MSDNVTRGKITPRQRLAMEKLLTGADVASAETAAKVSRQTVYRWQRSAPFADALAEAEAEKMSMMTRGLLNLGATAMLTLYEGMKGKATGTQVRAADAVYNRMLQLRELWTLEARISALETAAARTEQ